MNEMERLRAEWREHHNARVATRKGELYTEMSKLGRDSMYIFHSDLASEYIAQMAILEWILAPDE
jgi:hypothetical protein